MEDILDKIHEHELPLVPCMIHPHDSEGVEFTFFVLEELKKRATMDVSARWALETIAELQRLWFESTDKLHAIDAIIRKN